MVLRNERLSAQLFNNRLFVCMSVCLFICVTRLLSSFIFLLTLTWRPLPAKSVKIRPWCGPCGRRALGQWRCSSVSHWPCQRTSVLRSHPKDQTAIYIEILLRQNFVKFRLISIFFYFNSVNLCGNLKHRWLQIFHHPFKRHNAKAYFRQAQMISDIPDILSIYWYKLQNSFTLWWIYSCNMF